MTAFYVLLGVLTVLAGVFVYADARGWDPFPRLYGTDPRELVDRARDWRMDLRQPGEAFCANCPDHEACATAWPCELVQHVDREARAS